METEVGAERLARVNEIVSAVGNMVGVAGAALDEKFDRSFGDFGVSYVPASDLLRIRVIVSGSFLANDPENVKEAFRKVTRALNDPKIGGMYEKDGGSFELNEQTRYYYLVKDLANGSHLSPEAAVATVSRLRRIGEEWAFEWFGEVADVAHGHSLPPQARIPFE